MSNKLSSVKLNSIVKGIQKLYPVALADSSWDNTGLLVDSSYPDHHHHDETTNATAKILLTIDLTKSVVEEAIAMKANLVLAYHPFIFRGLKTITHNDPQQSSLIKLIQHNISVYSPHTAIDAAIGGVNDWICDGLKGEQEEDGREVLEASKVMEGAGMGRLVTLKTPISIEEMISRVKKSLGIEYVQLATPLQSKLIKTIAVCAGSGSGVFKNVKADCYYTGELSHHEALFFKENGNYVITCNHSNTERGFLVELKRQLLEELKNDNDVVVEISQTDADPFKTV